MRSACVAAPLSSHFFNHGTLFGIGIVLGAWDGPTRERTKVCEGRGRDTPKATSQGLESKQTDEATAEFERNTESNQNCKIFA